MSVEAVLPISQRRETFFRTPNKFVVNQRVTAPDMAIAFADYKIPDANARAFLEGGPDALSRRFCPLAAFGTVYNVLKQERIIGGDTALPIGELLRKLAEYHKQEGLVDNVGNEWAASDTWEVFDTRGRIRSQAIVTAARSLDMPAEVVEGVSYPDMIDFVDNGGKVALSLDNKFVNDITDPNLPKLNPAGHVVAVIGASIDNDCSKTTLSIADPNTNPVQLPIIELPIPQLLPYLPEDPETHLKMVRGMVFANAPELLAPFQKFHAPNALYPEKVIKEMHDWAMERGL